MMCAFKRRAGHVCTCGDTAVCSSCVSSFARMRTLLLWRWRGQHCRTSQTQRSTSVWRSGHSFLRGSIPCHLCQVECTMVREPHCSQESQQIQEVEAGRKQTPAVCHLPTTHPARSWSDKVAPNRGEDDDRLYATETPTRDLDELPNRRATGLMLECIRSRITSPKSITTPFTRFTISSARHSAIVLM